MARSPRARVSKTSGQGVSRLSYQRGYALAGSANAPSVAGQDIDHTPRRSSGRDYAKGGGAKFNIEYGEDQVATRTLDDVEKYAGEKPRKGLNLTRKIGKDIK